MSERNAIRGRLHQCALSVGRNGKAEFPDRLFDRHVASTKKFPRKGMATHEEQMENKHGEAKIVMVGCANDVIEFFFLQLRRRVTENNARVRKSEICRNRLS